MSHLKRYSEEILMWSTSPFIHEDPLGGTGDGSVCAPYRHSAVESICGSSTADCLSHLVLPQPIKIRRGESKLQNWTNFVVKETHHPGANEH